MAHIDNISFRPDTREVQAHLHTAAGDVLTEWTLDETDADLAGLLSDVLVTVDEIQVARTADGYEIGASMSIGGRPFLTSWTVDAGDTEFIDRFRRLLSRADATVARRLQAILSRDLALQPSVE
ncbi:MAG TPA: hypothetical protein VFB58_12420 [Chloroflexota bacterium]|nr:hypothetical protein [Chloroflexota bacterium]